MMQKGVSQQEFKQTEIGRIPKEWEVRKLDDIASEVYRYPTYYNIEYVYNGVPEIRGELIKENGEMETDLTKYRYISYETSRRFPRTILKEGDFVMSVRGTMGKIAVIRKALEGANITANLMRLSLNPSKCHPGFFKQVFLSKKFQEVLNSLSPQTTIKTIQAPKLKSIKLLLPPLPEQKKIAEILSTVDKAIEKVSEALEKTERLKKGLMQELLTRGIGHKEFKDTEIGRIPKEWEVVSLGNSAEVIMGQSPSGDTYNEKMEGLPLINGPSEFGERYPIPFKWTTEPTKTSRKGDILICVRGHTTGRLNISNGIYCAGRGIAIIRSKERVSHNLFIYYILESNREKIYGMSYAAGSTFPNITNGQLNKFSIPLPPLAEQKKIAEILSTVDKRLELLRKKKEKLERVKKGLMDDLLSGRKRIKI